MNKLQEAKNDRSNFLVEFEYKFKDKDGKDVVKKETNYIPTEIYIKAIRDYCDKKLVKLEGSDTDIFNLFSYYLECSDELENDKDFEDICKELYLKSSYYDDDLDDVREDILNENKSLEEDIISEASSAQKKSYKQGGEATKDLIFGKSVARVKNPRARQAAINARKAGREDIADMFIGDRKKSQADAANVKKSTQMAKAGLGESIDLNKDYHGVFEAKGDIIMAKGNTVKKLLDDIDREAGDYPEDIYRDSDFNAKDFDKELEGKEFKEFLDRLKETPTDDSYEFKNKIHVIWVGLDNSKDRDELSVSFHYSPDKAGLSEGLGQDFYGTKEGTEEADDLLFGLQVEFGQPKYDYDDFRAIDVDKHTLELAKKHASELDKFNYFKPIKSKKSFLDPEEDLDESSTGEIAKRLGGILLPKGMNTSSYKYEILWREGADKWEAEQADPKTVEFNSRKEAINFYDTHKNDVDKFNFWVTKRDSETWEVVEDIIG